MNTMNVRLQLSATDKKQSNGEVLRTYRVNYFVGRGDGFEGGSGVAVLVTKPDAPLSMSFKSKAGGAYEICATMVSGDQCEKIGGVTVDAESVTPEVAVKSIGNQFRDAMEAAFFDATCALVVTEAVVAVPSGPIVAAGVSAAAPVMASHPAPHATAGLPPAKAGFKRFFSRRNLIGAGLFIGAATTVYGMTAGKPHVDPIEASMQGENYKDLQAQIRAQIAAAAKSDVPMVNGKNDGLGGQNVAIETMKAMGLDPGKANAGCLVGVK